MIDKLKQLVRALLYRCGYRIVKVPPYDQNYFEPEDAENLKNFMEIVDQQRQEAVASVGSNLQASANYRQHYSYYTPARACFFRQCFDVIDENSVDVSGRSILDVGCYLGYLPFYAKSRYSDLTISGTEITDELPLEIARAACDGGDFFAARADTLHQGKFYDLIFLTQVLEYLKNLVKAILDLTSSLAAGGSVILTVPNGRYDSLSAGTYSEKLEYYQRHVNFWSPESWYHFFENNFPDFQVATKVLSGGNLIAVVTPCRTEGSR